MIYKCIRDYSMLWFVNLSNVSLYKFKIGLVGCVWYLWKFSYIYMLSNEVVIFSLNVLW